ncbi:MAG: hypothetical protein A3E88_03655 [Legionellales bacterium RIFCSPHIGHO2_12_FULL_35_11]|nr:MAG: hypothetical protein A3E88_03655 [Legionellales bacterium RIFCSPHIGHO2_12_FULL_35_11]
MIKNIFVLIWLFMTFSSSCFADENICDNGNCKIIIDAGSSGSRAHVYQYDKDAENNIISIQEIYSNKITPGFASVSTSGVDAYLDNLFNKISIKNIPVYFYATAGMRLLPDQEQKVLYQKLQDWFSLHKDWNLIDARTISGKEEGVYGWLATNYSLDTLRDNYHMGFIEIGGASTQIVFPVVNLEGIHPEDLVNLHLYNKDITLFAHSFLGLGANAITTRFKDYSDCFPVGYHLDNNQIGSGNARLCEHEIYELINADNYISDIERPANINNPQTKWYTVGAASSISRKSPINFQDEFNADELLEKADSVYCKTNWDTQVSEYGDDKFLNQNCIISSFIYSLSVESYGFSPQQEIYNIPENQTGDWTVGVLFSSAL